MLRGASLLVLAVVACSPEVLVEEPSGSDVAVSSSSSSSSVGGGGSGAGGSGAGGSGAGASGGGGAGGSPGVPGCEVLVRSGELLKVPGSFQGHLLDAGAGRIGAVYMANNGSPGIWATRSRVFDSQEPWPAFWTEELVNAENSLEVQYPASSREDGLMVVKRMSGWYVASFFQPGVLMQTPAGATPYARPILEPYPGVGVYWPAEGELHYYPSYDATEPSAVLPFVGNGLLHGVDGDGELVLVGDDGFSLIQEGQLVPLGNLGVDLSTVEPGFLSLVPREGGFWLSYVDANDAVAMVGVSKDGLTEPYRPFGEAASGYRIDVTPWRNGVAIASSVQTPEARLSVAVTDGEHTTVLPISSDEISYCENGLSVVSSPDGNSIYIGYLHCPPDEVAFVVERFDCASP